MKPPMVMRSIRVPEKLWAAAKAMTQTQNQPYLEQGMAPIVANLRAAADLMEAGVVDSMEDAVLAARGYLKPARSATLALRGLHIMRADHCPTIRVLRQYLAYLHYEGGPDPRILRDLAEAGASWEGCTVETTAYVTEGGLRVKRREEVSALRGDDA